MGLLESFQAHNRQKRQEEDAEIVNDAIADCIEKAAMALREAGVDEEQIKRLLCKYWDLRPSEAECFIQRTK